jgi:hypothetical protein
MNRVVIFPGYYKVFYNQISPKIGHVRFVTLFRTKSPMGDMSDLCGRTMPLRNEEARPSFSRYNTI